MSKRISETLVSQKFSTIALLIMTLFSASSMLKQTSAAEFSLKTAERIVFLGDSITQAGAGPTGYVTLAAKTLAEEHAGLKTEVIGAGISGNKVPDLEARLDRDVLSKKPTVVVIYIGINDVWHSQMGKGTPADVYEQGLVKLIERINKAGARVVLCTASVIGEKTDGTNPLDKMLDEYCQISRDVAAQTKTPLIDLRKAFLNHLKKENPSQAEKGILTTDGVHLNAAGNQFVAAQMLAGLGIADKEKKMLRHVVLFKFKKSTTPEQIQQVVDGFRELPKKIDVIKDFEYGTDVSVENLSQGFTHGFLVTFQDEKGRDTYLPHPDHKAFVELVLPLVDQAFVFDYWQNK